MDEIYMVPLFFKKTPKKLHVTNPSTGDKDNYYSEVMFQTHKLQINSFTLKEIMYI